MRLAIVSDIHGNLTAFEAVLTDLREASPDRIWHGGDLADGGSSPVEIVDSVRELGWPGVMGNTDQMLVSPQSFTEFAAGLPQLAGLFAKVGDMAEVARQQLGPERLSWLATLPPHRFEDGIALVHATPGNYWKAPKDEELLALNASIAVFGHTHVPFVRRVGERVIANSGSVGLPYDNDPRAAYLLIDGSDVQVRRVAYDVNRESRLLRESGMPHAEWVAAMLARGAFQMP